MTVRKKTASSSARFARLATDQTNGVIRLKKLVVLIVATLTSAWAVTGSSAHAADFKWFGEHAAESDQFPIKWQGDWCEAKRDGLMVTEYRRSKCADPVEATTFTNNSIDQWEVRCTLVEGFYDKQHDVYKALWLCGFSTAWAIRAEY